MRRAFVAAEASIKKKVAFKLRRFFAPVFFRPRKIFRTDARAYIEDEANTSDALPARRAMSAGDVAAATKLRTLPCKFWGPP